jgi:hypothetical protein
MYVILPHSLVNIELTHQTGPFFSVANSDNTMSMLGTDIHYLANYVSYFTDQAPLTTNLLDNTAALVPMPGYGTDF